MVDKLDNLEVKSLRMRLNRLEGVVRIKLEDMDWVKLEEVLEQGMGSSSRRLKMIERLMAQSG